MQRPIILLATSDLAFEAVALDAILATSHGVRCVHSVREACHALLGGTTDLAMAVIDLDFDGGGELLLQALSGCEPDFPILVIAHDHTTLKTEHLIAEVATARLNKVVTTPELEAAIGGVCCGCGGCGQAAAARKPCGLVPA